MRQLSIRLFDPGSMEARQLIYVVVAARFLDKWIFVRHFERNTWEMVSGHIEGGETADQAVRCQRPGEVRELLAELRSSGAIDTMSRRLAQRAQC